MAGAEKAWWLSCIDDQDDTGSRPCFFRPHSIPCATKSKAACPPRANAKSRGSGESGRSRALSMTLSMTGRSDTGPGAWPPYCPETDFAFALLPHLRPSQSRAWPCGRARPSWPAAAAGTRSWGACSPWGSAGMRRASTCGSGCATEPTGRPPANPCQVQLVQLVQLDVQACFAPLLRWVLAWWQGPGADPGRRPHGQGRGAGGPGRQRGLPRPGHPRGLAHQNRRPVRSLDAGPLCPAGSCRALGPDRARALRPGPAEPRPVGGHPPSGLGTPTCATTAT